MKTKTAMVVTAGLLGSGLWSTAATAADGGQGSYGFSIAVGVGWTMNIDSATINHVDKDSPAERAHIVVGDVITEIEACKIPGCGAYKAKKLMAKAVGETLHLRLRHADGTEYQADVVAGPPSPAPSNSAA